nr:hypothetical protein HK105_001023 [Polyrhizophydium stewartii]
MQHFGNAYTNCFTVYMPDLPHNYFFGLSASTDHSGTDDHDIESFELYEYNPPPREHKMRPNEEEDIAKGRKFHMDDTLRAEIKHAEEDVRHLREAEAEAEGDHEEEGVNSQSVQKLEENQFKIIEALNLIEQKLEIVATARRASAVVNEVLTPAHQNEFENRLVGQFGILQTEIDDIRDHARVLHRQVDELKDLTHRLLTAIDGKLGQTKRVVEETRANIASSSAAAGASRGQEHIGVVYYALYLFAALAGVALIIAAWSYHIRARERQLKKFI